MIKLINPIMRAQARGLADRAAQAGLAHIVYALEVVVMLLDEAETKSGQRRRGDA